MINENKEIEHFANEDNEVLEQICEIVRQHNTLQAKHLAQITADLCGVDCEEMLNDKWHLKNCDARSLYWYAYRYLTGESYSAIATKPWQGKYAVQSVCDSLKKMHNMIGANTVWTKRWTILKHIIKGILAHQPVQQQMFDDEVTIRIISPKNVHIQQIKQ